MPYALRNRKLGQTSGTTAAKAAATRGGAAEASTASSPTASKKTLNSVIAEIKNLGEKGVAKSLRKVATGGVSKRAHPKVKATAEKAHNRVIKQIQTLGPAKPSETKQRMTTAKVRESVTAQIAKRAVDAEVKKLGAGNPIKRVARVHVKKGVDLRAVNGGGVRDARSKPKAASVSTRTRKVTTKAETLQKALNAEIVRMGAQTPSEAKIKAEIASKFSAVNTEIKKRAVLRDIKEIGSSRLRKTTKADSKK
ncbi:hypothetical protein HDU96_005326 [Phlyctochytrium bullatum]|nr:hypothetical protein HDU96_005326 [Phlyctochytrium bullatum]